MDDPHKDTVDGLEKIVRDLDAWVDRHKPSSAPVGQAELDLRTDFRARLQATIQMMRSWRDPLANEH